MRTSLILLTIAILAVSCAPPPSEPKAETPENGSFQAELNGHSIHYAIHGKGPVVMTVPNSWGLSHEGLRAMYRPLEEHVTMVYFDPRGMGGSGPIREESDLGPEAVREDFEALRKHLGLEKVHAIGWSNGATNLVAIASDQPETIDAAIFVHGNASFLPGEEKPIVEAYPDLMEEFAAFEKEIDDAALPAEEQNARVKTFDTEVWFPYMFTDREEGKKRLPEVFRDASFSWAHAQYTNQQWATLDFRDRLPKIRARCLVLAGRHDMLPPEKAKEIADGVPGSEFVIFEESGHFAPIEETEKFVSTVIGFLGIGKASE